MQKLPISFLKTLFGLVFLLGVFSIFNVNPVSAGSLTLQNYWPMQLGNYWVFEVTQFSPSDYQKWGNNFSGIRTGIPAGLDCTNDINNCAQAGPGSKTSMVVYPSMGYDRFFTTRYLQWFKESSCAYHGPKYCNLITNAPTSWNLQWYMHSPVTENGFTWLGSEGGVHWTRSVLDGRNEPSGSFNLESLAEISTTGKFPKNTLFHDGAGRYPELGTQAAGLTGYSYIPLYNIPEVPNTNDTVQPDFTYNFALGCLIGSDFRVGISAFINDCQRAKLTWELEFIPLKAGSILTKNFIPSTTDMLGVVFFEPYYYDANPDGTLKTGEEIACEAYFFAKNIGPVKITHSIVTVLPNDPLLDKTRQLCFSRFKNVFAVSEDPLDRSLTFNSLNSLEPALGNLAYSYPINSFEITDYKIYSSPASDELGFRSPTAASLMDVPEPNSQVYFANGKYWIYRPNGELYSQGTVQSAWIGANPTGYPSLNQPGVTIYPWSNNGPDAIEYGPDLVSIFGTSGLIINDGVYWTHSPGSASPFSGPSGYLRDLLPGYEAIFGTNTDNLALSGTGQEQILLIKDGYYIYYKRDMSGSIIKYLEGKLMDLPGWVSAPQIAGQLPLWPDTMMYGRVFSETYNNPPVDFYDRVKNRVESDTQLIVFAQGRAWVKYGLNGNWEDWAGHLRQSFTGTTLKTLLSIYENPTDNAYTPRDSKVNMMDAVNSIKQITASPIARPSSSSTPILASAPIVRPTPTPTLRPTPTSTPTPRPTPSATPSPTPLTQASGFDQTAGDTATGSRPRQTVLSTNGQMLYQRYYENNTWQNWSPVAVTSLGISGVTSIKNFDQSLALDGTPRQSVVSLDGSLLYVRVFQNNSWQVWSQISVASLGIPGVATIVAFDQITGDAATQNRPKQTVISADGTLLYTRFYENSAWSSWTNSSVSSIGVSGVSQIKSFNQTLAPSGEPKQDVLSADGGTLYTRIFSNTTWGSWTNIAVATLGIVP